jgi:putative membrane-bound dehydrogenase-like protein
LKLQRLLLHHPIVKRQSFQSFLLLAILSASVVCGLAQGYSPSEAVSHMTLPGGLEARVVAAEPTVSQPVAIEFDDRGRLWVIQYLQYPNPAGLQRVKVDRFSRTAYDKVPEPPPHGPKGSDRITILGTPALNGKTTDSKDFINGLNLASGLAFGHGGVFVLQTPYLLFYPDRNGDDVPDSNPEVLLTGFGMEDAHSVANSLTWGPDGWLYGCQGSTVTARILGIEFQQGVWRYHPISRRFELFCEGGGNSWGLDFDDEGELLYATNFGEYRMLHGVQGGYYWKSFGKHGALHNPYTYGFFEHVPYKNFTGGHVTVGGIIYQGDALPREFRGKYIAGDLLGHSVQWHSLERWGSTFRSGYGGELLVPHDTWFASSDVTMGPGGTIFVADWFDKRTAHPDPDADWDRSNGRIYEIRPIHPPYDLISTNLKNIERVDGSLDLKKLSSRRLVELLGSRNDWFVRKARRVLADRRDKSVIPALRKQALESSDDHLALESLWALYVSGGFNEKLASKLLSHRNPAVRRWTVRLLGDENRVSPAIAKQLLALAKTEPEVSVRAQLACLAKRISAEHGLPIAEAILARNLDAKDPYIPLLLWWSIEHQAVPAMEQVTRTFIKPAAWESAMTREVILPRLMRRYAAESTVKSYAACASLLESAPGDNGRNAMLAALDQGLPATSNGEDKNAVLLDPLRKLWKDDSTDVALIRILARLGHEPARKRAIALAENREAKTEARVAMLALLGEIADPSCVGSVLSCVSPTQPESVQLAALSSLQSFPNAEIRDVLAAFSSLSAPVRSKARDVFLSRKSWAALFLGRIDAGTLAAGEVPVDQLQKVALLDDANLDALVRKHWGNITAGTEEEKLADVRRFNNDLRAFPGNASPGHEIFTKNCGVCHRLFGEGGQIGPDLTGANRKDRDYLLVNTVDPSAVIRKEFANFNVQTEDGQTVSGLIAEQSPDSVTLLLSTGERCSFPRTKIKVIEESKTSLMPERLLHGLTPQELRDLFAYLQADNPLASSKH